MASPKYSTGEWHMTIQELITKVQEEKPNSFTDAKLVTFIDEIETDVAEQLCVDREGKYTAEDSMDVTLLAPAPYDRLYVSWLKSQIDYANEEYASYQLNADQFELDFSELISWIVRTGQAPENAFPRRFRNVF